MLKRFFLALAFAGLLSPAYSAGTIPYSLSQQNDEFGKPLAGCKLYTIQAGTVSTPQNAYSDTDLTIALTNPIICDAAGRLPQFFLADGSIKIRLTKSTGVNVVTADGILVVGASSGGSGGSPVDATTVLATGDLKARYGTGALSGFVRANGRTIGSATSGATERANADCQTLFEYLWDTDANLSVSTGRGVSSSADWAANKTIALPDWRGRALAALDDMGSTAAGRLTATYFGTAATTLGAAGGAESQTLSLAQIPTGITSPVSIPALSIPGLSIPGLSIPGLSVPGLSIPSLTTATTNIGTIPISSGAVSSLQAQGAATTNITPNNSSGTWSGTTSLGGTTGTGTTGAGTTGTGTTGTGSTGTGSTGTASVTATSNNTSGGAHPIASPMMLATIYVKL